MNRFLKKSGYYFTFGILCLCICLSMSCASGGHGNFQRKIKQMSDNDLIDYYRGINERIKDIDRETHRENSPSRTEHERVVSNMPFFLGGDGYDLVKKRDIALKELNHRKIVP